MAGSTEDRTRRRVLRFLAKGAAQMRPTARDGYVLLDGGDRGAMSVAQAALQALEVRDLIVLEGRCAALTMAGQGAAKRAVAAGDPFRAQHQECAVAAVETPAGRETVIVNHAESPLAMLRRRKAKDGTRFLSEAEYRAGERLRSDYGRGRIMPRMGVKWSAAGASGQRRGDVNGIGNLTDAALAARQRVEQAIVAVGPELAGVLIDVCCFLKGLERVEMERGWPARSAKIVLKSALSALARHYEPAPGNRGRAARPILHWGTEDYRPRLG